MDLSTPDALAYDRSHLWHPYTSPLNPPPVFLAERAHDTQIVLADGTELTDAVSSWWCVAHGHNHPHITKAIQRQSEALSHVMFGGFTHRPAIELARRIAQLTPEGLDSIFFADSGSISVEVATKMAVQYQYALGHPNRNRLLALRGGYHGDTAGAMALSDPDGMHKLFAGLIPRHFFADAPTQCPLQSEWNESAFDSIRTTLEAHRDEIAAVICEPVFQAANAMWFYHPNYLRRMRELCDEHGILLIFDEIAAGFYRTGPLWAHARSGISPDIICIGKALTGGHLTLAATATSHRIAQTISNGFPGAFMHGPTYMANPLACAAGIASLDLFAGSDYAASVRRIEQQLHTGLTPLRSLPNVTAVRVLGAVGIVEVESPPRAEDVRSVILDHGIWLRPFGNFIYTMPPLVTPPETIGKIIAAIADAAALPPGPPVPADGFHE